MVITVEPGLYLPDHPNVPEELRGIGIRIEDDVLITEDGYGALTRQIAIPTVYPYIHSPHSLSISLSLSPFPSLLVPLYSFLCRHLIHISDILTKNAPKERDEIEALMGER